MKLTLFTDYSIRVLMYVAGKRGKALSTAKEISEYHGISYHHITKVIHALALKGYLESIKGREGGIRLRKEPENINMRQLFLELESDFNLVECFDRKNNTCRIIKTCRLRPILKEASAAFINILSKYTLADIL